MIKRLTLSIICLLLLLISSSTAFAHEENNTYYPDNFIVLGDSISTGYGLEGYQVDEVYTGYCKDNYNVLNYAKMLAQKYNTINTYKNFAQDGLTAKGLLDEIATGNYDEYIKSTDYFFISTGGNDILLYFYDVIGQALDMPEDYSIFDVKDIDFTEKKVYTDFFEFVSSGKLGALKKEVTENFQEYFLKITEYIKKTNPNAKIIYQTVFNPFSNVKMAGPLDSIATAIEKSINKIIIDNSETVQDYTKVQNYYYVDVYSAFFQKANTYTNIKQYDIHPNAEGHKYIAQLIDEKLKMISGIEPNKSPAVVITDDEISSSDTDLSSNESNSNITQSDNTSNNKVVGIIIGFSVCTVAVITFFMLKTKK